MATVYSRITAFYEANPDFRFSKGKTKSIYRIVKSVYDKNPDNPPVTYLDVEANGEPIQVRNYPESFTYIIDAFIKRLHEDHIRNVAEDEARKGTGTTKQKKGLKKPAKTPQAPVNQKKERKRIPAQKPLYSTKNFKK